MADIWDVFDMVLRPFFLIGLRMVDWLVVPGFGRIVSCTARIISTWEARSFPRPAIPVVTVGVVVICRDGEGA